MPQVYGSINVSFPKGNTEKSGQAYKDTYAFRVNKSSKVAKKITAMPLNEFNKYKLSTQMKRRCTRERNVCAKCQESREIVLTISEQRRGSSQNRSSSSILAARTSVSVGSIYRQMQRKAKKGEDDGDEEGEDEDSDEDDSDGGDENNEDEDSEDERKK
ncbi:hypothetical protein BGZ90_006443 [Linnemannia elongata]|nr:hypothetical protein BGZ90_006443 [Linnemannia elongata]